jgi:hypothetical protein
MKIVPERQNTPQHSIIAGGIPEIEAFFLKTKDALG